MYINKYLLTGMLCLLTLFSRAQVMNNSTEVTTYRETDGKIIIPLMVNGEQAEFVLDLSGHMAVLPEYLEKLKINPEESGQFSGYNTYQYKDVAVKGIVKINTLTFGNSIYGNDISAFILEDAPYLRELGVAGIVNGSIFRNAVLTIDADRKNIVVTAPYRPSYMKLDYRTNFKLQRGYVPACTATLNGESFEFILDTWNEGLVVLNEEDFSRIRGAEKGEAVVSVGYGRAEAAQEVKTVDAFSFVKSQASSCPVALNPSLHRSVLGSGILKMGLLSIDFSKEKVYFQPFGLSPVTTETEVAKVNIEPGKLNAIDRGYFLEHIYDYRKSKEFIFRGKKAVVVDFWASWCGPCMRLIPELEKMAEKYKDEVLFLKVNADVEKELCNVLHIQALPTLFFIPVGGKPIVELGAQPEKIEQIIRENLLKH